MGTQSADIEHLNTDYTSIETKLQECVIHVSMCPLRWCFIFIWLCISTIQPWSNIKVSQPVWWLVMFHCVIWWLCVCVCVCVCVWCWHCHHSLKAAVHLWQKDLCSQADHPPKGLAWRNRNYWVHSFPQHKDIKHNLYAAGNNGTTDCTSVTKHSSGSWYSLVISGAARCFDKVGKYELNTSIPGSCLGK